MGRNTIHLVIFLAAILIISCGSGPAPETRVEPMPEPQVQQNVVIQEEEIFDPARVSEDYYLATRTEVRQFIERLNNVIRNRDFESWRAALSPELLASISSEENLRQISEQPIMRSRRIVLSTAEDYFIHLVVPSRANIAGGVDNIDIEFITMNRVKAFTITTDRAGEEHQVRLYDLEKIGNSWTIID